MLTLDDLRSVTQPIYFITNDPARAIGLENLLPDYHIVCLDDTPLVDEISKAGISILCLERELGRKNTSLRSSSSVLDHPRTLAFIAKTSQGKKPHLLFFKPQAKIDFLARKYHFALLGNTTKLSRSFEDKVAFWRLCQKYRLPVPPGTVISLQDGQFDQLSASYGLPLVIQFGRGWAGNSTHFISDKNQFTELQLTHTQITVKVSRYITGITCLNNAVYAQGVVYQSEPAIQIKANPLLTSLPGGTGGRQWPAPITAGQTASIQSLTNQVGLLMGESGYRGIFGLDFLIDSKTGQVFLSENNARQTASTAFYTKREIASGTFPLLGLHLLSFLDLPITGHEYHFKPAGSQIVGRNTGPRPLLVTTGFPPGNYTTDLTLQTNSYYLTCPDSLFITTAAPGRLVNPEVELFHVDTTNPVVDSLGELLPPYSQVVSHIKTKLLTNA